MEIIINEVREKWKVGDVLKTSDNHVFMICHKYLSQLYFLCELESGCCLGNCKSLDELIKNLINDDDVKVNCTCEINL